MNFRAGECMSPVYIENSRRPDIPLMDRQKRQEMLSQRRATVELSSSYLDLTTSHAASHSSSAFYMRKKRPESVDRSGDADAAQDGKHTKKASSERSMHVANGRAERVATSPAAGNGLRRSRRKRSINAVSGVVAGADNVGPSSRTASASPAKKRRQSSKYAPPSKYAHLKPLTDILEPNLICVFVGFNPGVKTAQSGHAYAHPSNMFWKLLHSSGCTDERLKPEQDVDLPRLYSMGNTNIVARPSKDAAELSKAESAAGTPILEEKVRKYRPEAVCIVGKGIWESIWRWRYKREIQKHEFRYGWQDEKERIGRTDDWPGAVVFVATATSGLAANLRPHEKEAIWKPFGDWVKQRRRERNFATSVFGPDR